MDVVEHFDPRNHTHINAYRHLCSKGSWPQYFIDEFKDKEGGYEAENHWSFRLVNKITNIYIEDYRKPEVLKAIIKEQEDTIEQLRKRLLENKITSFDIP